MHNTFLPWLNVYVDVFTRVAEKPKFLVINLNNDFKCEFSIKWSLFVFNWAKFYKKCVFSEIIMNNKDLIGINWQPLLVLLKQYILNTSWENVSQVRLLYFNIKIFFQVLFLRYHVKTRLQIPFIKNNTWHILKIYFL